MQLLAKASWTTVWLIAAAWCLAWLIASGVAIWIALRPDQSPGQGASGGLAAVGFSLTLRGAVVILGPPIALVMLRAFASFRS